MEMLHFFFHSFIFILCHLWHYILKISCIIVEIYFLSHDILFIYWLFLLTSVLFVVSTYIMFLTLCGKKCPCWSKDAQATAQTD